MTVHTESGDVTFGLKRFLSACVSYLPGYETQAVKAR
jgi:hypothetical protein